MCLLTDINIVIEMKCFSAGDHFTGIRTGRYLGLVWVKGVVLRKFSCGMAVRISDYLFVLANTLYEAPRIYQIWSL